MSAALARPAAALALCMAVAAVGAATAQTPIPPAASDFATAMSQSDDYEVQAAQDALAQSRNPQIRAFAQQMIADHSRSSDSLRQAAAASRLPPAPPGMGRDQAAMLLALQSLRGPLFDQAYAKQQVLAHTQAVTVNQSFAAAGTDPNLRAFAQSSAPVLQHHLMMAQQLRMAVGGD